MPDKTVVVLGGGIGGLVTAHRLARKKDGHRIVLVERDPVYRFASSFLWVLNGTRRPEQITVDLRRLTARRGIELAQAEVQAIDVDAGRVETSTGPIPYDRLVVALGAELAPDLLPGFAEAAHNVYTLEGALSAGRALGELQGGRVVVLVSRLPYKCPAAPYETALLAERTAPQARPARRHNRRRLHARALPDADRRARAGRGAARHPRATADRLPPRAHRRADRARHRASSC